MRSFPMFVGLSAVVLAPGALAQQAGVKATVNSVVESRELELVKSDSPFSGWNNKLEIKLHIDGADVKDARKVGNLKITKAVDDAGTDLTKEGTGPADRSLEGFHDVRDEQQMGMMGRDQSGPKSGFDIEIRLPTVSARKATSIKQLSATAQVLVGGEKKVIEVKKLKSALGKPVDDPALKALGVAFALVDPAKASGMGMMMMGGEKDRSVPAEISGKLEAIASVTVVDSAGTKVNSGSGWSDENGKRSISYELDKPLSDDMTLQIEIWPGQKTVDVPIELKDVKLP